VFGGDRDLVPARVLQAPWLTRVGGTGTGCVSSPGDRQGGRSHRRGNRHIPRSTCHNDKTGTVQAMSKEISDFPPLQQAGVRYRWDGKQSYGMLERSSLLHRIPMDS
jgi:hypothetical protein